MIIELSFITLIIFAMYTQYVVIYSISFLSCQDDGIYKVLSYHCAEYQFEITSKTTMIVANKMFEEIILNAGSVDELNDLIITGVSEENEFELINN